MEAAEQLGMYLEAFESVEELETLGEGQGARKEVGLG